MKYIYGPKRFPIGSLIEVKGTRHVKAGQQGVIKSYDPFSLHKFYVKFPKDGVFLIEGKYIKIIEMGPIVESKPQGKENLSKDFSEAYKRMKLNDTKFALYTSRTE